MSEADRIELGFDWDGDLELRKAPPVLCEYDIRVVFQGWKGCLDEFRSTWRELSALEDEIRNAFRGHGFIIVHSDSGPALADTEGEFSWWRPLPNPLPAP